MILKQKRLWDRRTFELKDKSILAKYKSPSKDIEVLYRLDQLGMDTVKFRKKEFSVFTGFLFIILLILGKWLFTGYEPGSTSELIILFAAIIFLFSCFALLFYDNRKKEIGIIGGERELSFLADKPTREAVENFINELLKQRKDLIIRRGLNIGDKRYPDEYRLSYLKELLSESYIDVLEFEKYKQLFINDSRKIGF